MKRILLINPKGGCGKSTLATNLASYYALWEVPVALIDYDPQGSSLQWTAQRTRELNPISGIDGTHGRINAGQDVRRVIMDAPARTSGAQLKKLLSLADVAVIPVLPSPIDIRAAASFVGELTADGLLRESRIGLVGNRVRENTLAYANLEKFLKRLKIPVVARLRDTQNYIRAAESGSGIFEMPPYQVDRDIEQWRPLINWIES